MLMALAIGSLVLVSLYNFYLTQKKTSDIRDQLAEMQQNARIGMALIVREVRMAGYNPTRTPGVGIRAAGPRTIRVTMDLNEDGDTNDENEDLTYSLYDSGDDGDLDLGRKPQGGANTPVVENVDNLHFVYTLRDGSSTSTPADPGQIRAVHVSLTTRTAKPDAGYESNGGHRTYTLQSVITPRNLAYE